jgi:uncharacterized membrane protein
MGEARRAMHRNLAEKAAALAPAEREKFVNAVFDRRAPFRPHRPDPPR